MPQIQIEKSRIPILYLDTNIMIYLSRLQNGKLTDHIEEIYELNQLLQEAVRRNSILLPLGNQLVEMGMTEDRLPARNFLYSIINSELLSPEHIQDIQYRTGLKAFEENGEELIFSDDSFLARKDFQSPFVVHAASVITSAKAEKLSEDKKKIANQLKQISSNVRGKRIFEEQLEVELSADAILMFENMSKEPENKSEAISYCDYIGETYSRAGITHFDFDKTENVQKKLTDYFVFLQSTYHHNLPYVDIKCNIWAYKMIKSDSIKKSDDLDSTWAAAYLLFVNYAVTDNAFRDTIEQIGLDRKYNTKVYSLNNIRNLFPLLKSITN